MTRRQAVPGAFHARDGWHFRRGEGGTVTVYCGDGDQELTVEPTVWASIVAAVSSPGETGSTYRHALAFHLGDLP